MSMIISRRIQFCAGHRLVGHEGRCAMAHGHNYVVLLSARSRGQNALDSVGRVIDFSVLKHRLGGWIDENWDHAFILWDKDLELLQCLDKLPGQRVYLLSANPTAENMARHLLHVVGPQLLADTDVELVRVKLWETENCCVEVSLE